MKSSNLVLCFTNILVDRTLSPYQAVEEITFPRANSDILAELPIGSGAKKDVYLFKATYKVESFEDIQKEYKRMKLIPDPRAQFALERDKQISSKYPNISIFGNLYTKLIYGDIGNGRHKFEFDFFRPDLSLENLLEEISKGELLLCGVPN
jgi:hypothetical protein